MTRMPTPAEDRALPREATALLDVAGLHVSFGHGREPVPAVRGISFTVNAGECLAIVGESGSGKSVTARTVVGLAGAGATVRAEHVRLDGQDLTRLSEREWRRVRGGKVGFVLQDALSSLDPLRRIGAEIGETLRNHRSAGRAADAERVVTLLEQASVPEPRLRAGQYPHELSGGLRQRALIASAVAADPALLIADEPTTALDVSVQARILELLAAHRERGLGLLLISHDLAVVAQLADRVAVMRHGVFVEQGPTAEVLADPAHAYTRQLLAAVPSIGHRRARMSGAAPGAVPVPAPDSPVVLRGERITKSYPGAGGTARPVVSAVSFELRAGESLGLLGESGSGKTTTAEIVLGLREPDSGSVELHGRPWSGVPEKERRALRRNVQVVHQDPLGSFDPRYTVEQIIGEALDGPGRGAVRRNRARITELLESVGLGPELRTRHPRQLSGGQRQRIAIARALGPRPDVLVCDEPVSALDVSVQAQILDLLADARATGVALLFISHDLGVISQCCDRVLVMKEGTIVEAGDVDIVLRNPSERYTRRLLAAVPRLPAGDPGGLRALSAGGPV
jgi:peptide/nickel transport system ATP-binding protein